MDPSKIAGEFDDAGLGDERLDARLTRIAVTVASHPEAPFPQVFPTDAELEAFYRFVRNERVTPDAILEPHVQATVERIAEFETVVAIHDTTEFSFKGDREGLGRLNRSGRGFHGHFALMVAGDARPEPLGVAALHTWTRTEETATAKRKKGLPYKDTRDLETEQARWGKQVNEVETRVAGVASIVHVMDSEADDYALLSALSEDNRRFVIRLCYDRLLDMEASGSTPHRKAKEFVACGQTVTTRKVTLSKRTRKPGGSRRKRTKERHVRETTLAISAKPLVFRRPRSTTDALPRNLPVNIVMVREMEPPSDAEPVEWMLITTEPIETKEQILQVVDYYRARWTIEEYFKALKTGCAYEKRQLDSLGTLLAGLALFVPIAWSLLRLRTIARDSADRPAEFVMTDTQLEVLRLRSPRRLPRKPSARDAMLAVAKLGGHIPRNGDPGWQVLTRGYHELLSLVGGYQLLRRKM